MNLTINNSHAESSSIVACDTYTWEWGNTDTTITETGSYEHTFTNASGCESVHTLSVTINNSQSYYYDGDEDGYGGGSAVQFCSDDVQFGWVTNNDDPCPYHAYTIPDACGKCGGDNTKTVGPYYIGGTFCGNSSASPSVWYINGTTGVTLVPGEKTHTINNNGCI